jgi:superfamily II DNA/RNA helicase
MSEGRTKNQVQFKNTQEGAKVKEEGCEGGKGDSAKNPASESKSRGSGAVGAGEENEGYISGEENAELGVSAGESDEGYISGEEDVELEDYIYGEPVARSQYISGVHVVDTLGEGTVISETFECMELREDIKRGVYSMGYEKPSPIQMTAITPLIKGRDIRAQAQSGTGKTAAFGIASLQRVDVKLRETQVLIMEPTRELAIQTMRVIKKIGENTNIHVEAVYGGVKLDDSIERLKDKAQVLIATPGRLLHLHDDGKISFRYVRLFLVDEADEMLKKGFITSINDIYKKIAKKGLQVGMFSATWGKQEQEITKEILTNPILISLKDEDQTLKGIKQYFVLIVGTGDRALRGPQLDSVKLEVLIDIYSRAKGITQSIIFCNRIDRAIELHRNLTSRGFACRLFHSEMSQEERNACLNDFKGGSCRILISSGLLSRGIDVQTLSLVINFDLPSEREIDNYIHRIGRTGRFGRKGTALNMASREEMDLIKKYEEHYNTTILPLPEDLSVLELTQ